MVYVMSDIHGCYQEFKAMLQKINLSNEDVLYILGDVIDRGEDGIKILQEMMLHDNIVPILGNHELMAFLLIQRSMTNTIDDAVIQEFGYWLMDGGESTILAFEKLSPEKQLKLIEYLSEFKLTETLEVNGKKFLLQHAGFSNFSKDRAIDSYSPDEVVYEQVDFDFPYYEEYTMITGHTPTLLLQLCRPPQIFKHNNHIAIDCGLVYGGRLACLCLDTMETYYIDNLKGKDLPDIF